MSIAMEASRGFVPSFVERKVLAQHRKLVQSWEELPRGTRVSNKATQQQGKKSSLVSCSKAGYHCHGVHGVLPYIPPPVSISPEQPPHRHRIMHSHCKCSCLSRSPSCMNASECKAKTLSLALVGTTHMPPSACLQKGTWSKVSVKLWSNSRPVQVLGGLQNSASRSQGAKITLKRKPAKAHPELLWPTVDGAERSRIWLQQEETEVVIGCFEKSHCVIAQP